MNRLLFVLVVGIGFSTNFLSAQDNSKASDPIIGNKKLSEWKKDLRSENASTRSTAFFRLRSLRAAAKPVVPLLLELGNDETLSTRLQAMSTLAAIGIRPEDVPVVAKWLLDDNARIRLYSRQILVRLADQPNLAVSKEALPSLKKALTSSDPNVSRTAAQLLAKMGSEAEDLLRASLESDNQRLRWTVLYALSSGKNSEVFLPQVTKALEDKELNIRVAAATALRMLGAKAKPALPSLRKALKDSSSAVQVQAALTISQFGEDAKESLPELFALFDKPNPPPQSVFFPILQNLGQQAVPYLRKSFQEGDRQRQLFALEALRRMGTKGVDALPDLEKLLQSEKDAGVGHAIALTMWFVQGPSDKLLDTLLEQPNATLTILGQPGAKLLITRFEKGDTQTQIRAMSALRRMGTAGVAAIEPIVLLLSHEDKAVRAEARRTIDTFAPYAVAALANLYAKGDPETIRQVGRILRRLDVRLLRTAAAVLVPVLSKRAKEAKDWIIRLDAAYLQNRFDGNADLLEIVIEAMKQNDAAVRRVAVASVPTRSLARPQAVADRSRTLLVEALKDESLEVRVRAAQGLLTNAFVSSTFTERKKLVPVLAAGLKSADSNTRQTALGLLNLLGADAVGAVDSIRPLVKDSEDDVRRLAVTTLMQIRPKAAVPEFAEALSDPNDIVRQLAAQALSLVGPSAKAAVPALTTALTDSNLNVRLSAAEALGKIGSGSASAVPKLIELLATAPRTVPNVTGTPTTIFPGRVVRPGFPGVAPSVPGIPGSTPAQPRVFSDPYLVLATALGRIGPKAAPAIAILEKRMADDPVLTLDVLSGIGKPAMPAMTRALASQDRETRIASLDAVGKANSVSDKAVEKVLDLVRSDDPELSHQALFALIQLGEQAHSAKKLLAQFLADEKADPQTRRLAARALGEIGPKAGEGIAVLRKTLQSDDPFLVRWSAYSLGEMGSSAKDALPKLEQLARSPYPYIRRAAQRAVRQIQDEK